ncbi:MAG: GxxExxY protein [Flavobacterium sp.]|uniref:GxxExxY protein n=1 Tax=Flavobacterium sp. TaxID=239 RepID=UPI00120394A3|nr:GxxExxY protein [Flavobacterium sp.]RZJ67314.1 MAG: GxxExxY protein [Flavobacterium sp.]
MIADKLLLKDTTDVILKCFYDVYNELGYGFLEKIYENAICYELRKLGFTVDVQKRIDVFYKEISVGHYFADLLVNEKIILEIKACENLIPEHQYQLINYLKATDCEVGLLLNFGRKPQFTRKVFENYRK